jgi:hypothetical protein
VYDPESPPDQAHICNFPNLHVSFDKPEFFARLQGFDIGTEDTIQAIK